MYYVKERIKMSEIDWIDKMETNQIKDMPDRKFISYLEYEEPNRLDTAFTVGLLIAIVITFAIMVSTAFGIV